MSEDTTDITAKEPASNGRDNISPDHAKRSLAKLITLGKITAEEEEQVWWFFCYYKENKLTRKEAGKLINRDHNTIYKIFTATYGAGYGTIKDEIVRFRKIIENRGVKNKTFIETRNWFDVEAACKSALYDSMPTFIYGISQIGKTKCLQEYAQRNNHGTTRLIRLSSAMSFSRFVTLVGDACYIPRRQHSDLTCDGIFNSVTNRNLLIFDEVHQAMLTTSELTCRKIVEFIREIYDRTECGIVLCGTQVLRDEFERGRQRLIFDQFKRRGMVELQLPDTPPPSDIAKIAASFGLEAPDEDTYDIIKEMLDESGVGKFFKFLQKTQNYCANKKTATEINWSDFRNVYEGIRALSKKGKNK